MKTRTVIACVAAPVSLLIAAHALLPLVAGAQPVSSAAAAPSAAPAPSTSAATSASVAAPVWFDLPPLAKEPIPDTRSDAPTAEEWKAAPLIDVTRRDSSARVCRVQRVREYLKVECPSTMTGVRMLAGDRKDVQLYVVPKADHTFTPPNGGYVVFPLRRKEPRLFQFFTVGFGYEGDASPEAGLMVDASWPDSAAGPTVVIR